MVRSIGRGALVVMLAWAGLARSQPAPSGNGSASPGGTLTVHENGKELPCRIVTTWQQPNGAKAYQLQIIASGEMLTLVEDGPATTYQGKSGKMKALSMRIYHWGNRRISPPGVPTPPPPERIIANQETAKPIVLSESDEHLVSLTPDPVLPPGFRMCNPPTPIAGGNLACNVCGGAPTCCGMVQNPGTGNFPYAQMPSGSNPGSVSQGPAGPSSIVQGTVATCGVTETPAANPMVSTPVQSNCDQPPPTTLAGQASSFVQPSSVSVGIQPATKPPPTLSRKIRNIFHHQEPAPAVEVVQTPAANTGDSQKPPAANTGVAQKTPSPTQPGAAASTSPAANAALPNTQPLNMPNRSAAGTPTTLPDVSPAQYAPATTSATTSSQDPKDTKTTEKKTTWEKIWGKPLFAKTKQPGQSTVNPSPTGTGPAVPPASGSTTATAQAKPAPGAQTLPASSAQTLPAPSAITGSFPSPTGPAMFPQPSTQGKLPTPQQASLADLQNKNDPLLNPEQIRSSRVDAKVGPTSTPSPLANVQQRTALPGQSAPAPAGGLQNQLPPMPMGGGSVMAAQNGLPIPYHYMPVPMVTVPNPLRNPGPPPPNVPEPPQPAAMVNAFTPARAAPKPGEGQQNQMPPNVAMGPFIPGPYGPMPDPRMMGYPFPLPQGMLPDPRMMGYPPPLVAQGMMPYPGMNPYMGQPQVANGPGVMPMMMPPMTPMGMQRPIAQVNYPSNYQGPMPPNPMIGSNMPAIAFAPPMMPPVPMVPYSNPAMDRPGMASGPGPGSISHLLGLLRDSISPAEREMAAINLNNQDWRNNPEVVQVLVSCARQDPAATVRASCVRTLAVQHVTTEPVLTALNALKNDPDPRVRQEVDQALVRLTGGQASVTTPALQPTSHRP